MNNIINKIKKMFNKKEKVITIRRIENIKEYESKKEMPVIYMDNFLHCYFSNNLTTEEILFQLKRDSVAKAISKGVNL